VVSLFFFFCLSFVVVAVGVISRRCPNRFEVVVGWILCQRKGRLACHVEELGWPGWALDFGVVGFHNAS